MKILLHYRNAFNLHRTRLSSLFFALTGLFLVFQFVAPVLTDASPTFDEYSATSGESNLSEVTAGSDGATWYVERGTDQIGRITTSGSVSDYSVGPSGSTTTLDGITAGPDGNIWFTGCVAGSSVYSIVGDITTSGSTSSVYTVTSGRCTLGAITAGPDGNLWFIDNVSQSVGSSSTIDKVTTSGTVSIGSGVNGATFNYITAGSDGNVWATDRGNNEIAKVDVSTHGITEYSIPTTNSAPTGIASGSDGALWFTEYNTSKIGRITTSGSVTEYSLSSSSDPWEIASGSDGALWFTDIGSTNAIGRITTSGSVTEYATPTNYSGPTGITAGSDGAMWFAENSTSKIGRLGY